MAFFELIEILNLFIQSVKITDTNLDLSGTFLIEIMMQMSDEQSELYLKYLMLLTDLAVKATVPIYN